MCLTMMLFVVIVRDRKARQQPYLSQARGTVDVDGLARRVSLGVLNRAPVSLLGSVQRVRQKRTALHLRVLFFSNTCPK
jgi:hypothetical protein